MPEKEGRARNATRSSHAILTARTRHTWNFDCSEAWEGGAVDGDSVNAFWATALTRVMRATVPIPAVASPSVLCWWISVVGVVRPL